MDSRQRPSSDRHHSGMSILEVLIVLGIAGIVAAIAIPSGPAAFRAYRMAGQGHAISYQVSLAKMRAASASTRARVYIDLTAGSYRLEVLNTTTNAWAAEGGTEQFTAPIGFGFGAAAAPPPNTQGSIGQAPPCLDDAGGEIADTSCVMFNSRGIPIDATGAPTGNDAVYMTDGTAVYATTVSATGMTQLWWTPAGVTAWQRQ